MQYGAVDVQKYTNCKVYPLNATRATYTVLPDLVRAKKHVALGANQRISTLRVKTNIVREQRLHEWQK
jgi:hypothetical protein